MAKHAKPTLTSTLSKNGARGAAALAMVSLGFLATAPTAFAGGDGDHWQDHKKNGHDQNKNGDDQNKNGDDQDKKGGDTHNESNDIDTHESDGVVNVADNNILVPVQVCNNYLPVNVLGVQVPIEEVEINPAIPILTDGDTEADSSDKCVVDSKQD